MIHGRDSHQIRRSTTTQGERRKTIDIISSSLSLPLREGESHGAMLTARLGTFIYLLRSNTTANMRHRHRHEPHHRSRGKYCTVKSHLLLTRGNWKHTNQLEPMYIRNQDQIGTDLQLVCVELSLFLDYSDLDIRVQTRNLGRYRQVNDTSIAIQVSWVVPEEITRSVVI